MAENANPIRSTLESPAPSKPSLFRSRRFRIFLAIFSFYGILVAIIPLGYPQPLEFAIALGAFFGPIVWVLRDKRKSRLTEEEFEAQWRERQSLRNEMLRIAHEVYPLAPIGSWLTIDATLPQRGFPKFHEERLLEFSENGAGIYRWIQHDLGTRGETAFEFKPAGEGTIAVRLKSLPATGWYTVPFEFDVHKNAFGKMEVLLCLNGENPLPEDLKIHWPFDLTFVRQEYFPKT